ncbi:metalloregulator ArsR/SmtB family transcription factor [Prescottella equi]
MSRNNEDRRFDAIAHPARRAVLMYLRDHNSARAGDMSRDLEIVPSTLSGHLRILREADLIVSSRRGTEIWYRTNFTVMEELLLCAARLLGQHKRK